MTMTAERLVVSYSEVDAARQCPFKHKLAYIDRWAKDDGDSLTPLVKGSAWHVLMEAHYRIIRMAQEDDKFIGLERMVLARAAAVVGTLIEGYENGELRALLTWMYDGYLQTYGPDSNWSIVEVENTIILPLAYSDGRPSRFDLKVKIDLIVADHKGSWWIVDHKSYGTARDLDFDFEEQFKFYTHVLRRMGYKIKGCIHNGALTKMNKGDLIKPGDVGYKASMKEKDLDKRFKRTLINYTDAELASVNDGILDTMTTVYGEGATHERHPNSDTCQWRCSFTEACLFGRRQGDDVKTLEMLQDTGWVQNFERH